LARSPDIQASSLHWFDDTALPANYNMLAVSRDREATACQLGDRAVGIFDPVAAWRPGTAAYEREQQRT
jgi:hypothetical protein